MKETSNDPIESHDSWPVLGVRFFLQANASFQDPYAQKNASHTRLCAPLEKVETLHRQTNAQATEPNPPIVQKQANALAQDFLEDSFLKDQLFAPSTQYRNIQQEPRKLDRSERKKQAVKTRLTTRLCKPTEPVQGCLIFKEDFLKREIDISVEIAQNREEEKKAFKKLIDEENLKKSDSIPVPANPQPLTKKRTTEI